jgi:DNA topoisomerase I
VKHEVKTEKSSRSKSGKVETEVKKKVKTETTETSSGKKKKKTEEEEEVWKWLDFEIFRWEEEKKGDGIKWNSLEHKGPLFAPPYEPLPKNVHFKYDGKVCI